MFSSCVNKRYGSFVPFFFSRLYVSCLKQLSSFIASSLILLNVKAKCSPKYRVISSSMVVFSTDALNLSQSSLKIIIGDVFGRTVHATLPLAALAGSDTFKSSVSFTNIKTQRFPHASAISSSLSMVKFELPCRALRITCRVRFRFQSKILVVVYRRLLVFIVRRENYCAFSWLFEFLHTAKIIVMLHEAM